MKKKWYRLRYKLLAKYPMFSLVGLLFESMGIKIDEDRFRALPKATQFLFGEIKSSKKLTKKDKSTIN